MFNEQKEPPRGLNLCDVLEKSVVNCKGILDHDCWRWWSHETIVWSIYVVTWQQAIQHKDDPPTSTNIKTLMSTDVFLDNTNFYASSEEAPVLAQKRILGVLIFMSKYHWCREETVSRVDDIHWSFSLFHLDLFNFIRGRLVMKESLG